MTWTILMDDTIILKNDIVNLFQEKGDVAKKDIEGYLKMVSSPEKRKLIKQIVKRLELDKNGKYYVRSMKSKQKN